MPSLSDPADRTSVDWRDRLEWWRTERRIDARRWRWRSAHRLLMAPLNTAGQGAQWARAARKLSDVAALSVRALPANGATAITDPPDVEISWTMQQHDRLGPYQRLVRRATHVLAESGRPVLKQFHAGTILDDMDELTDGGRCVAVVFHGSEVRDLHRHAAEHPHSPFTGEWDGWLHRVQRRVMITQRVLERIEAPLLVSTPDLLEHVPGAVWLPVVVDVAAFRTSQPVLERRRPVVLHAPSNARLKGTARIDEVLDEFDRRGVVTYRRVSDMPHSQMPALLASVDIVIDQVVLGNPGVLLAEAMAAGRVAIAHLTDSTRAAMQRADPVGEPVPVLQADPDTLASVLERILDDPGAASATAARGPVWAERNHDGARSSTVLAGAFGGCLLR